MDKKKVQPAKNPLNINPAAMMSTEVFEWISDSVYPDQPILEIGSGYGTHILLDLGYKPCSIEESKDWVNKYHNNYVYAPIDEEMGWYQTKTLKENFKKFKDIADGYGWGCVIIDGPTVNRNGILPYLDYLGIGLTPVVIDDIQRPENQLLLKAVHHHCQTLRARFWEDERFRKDNKEFIEKKYHIDASEGFLKAGIYTVPDKTASIIL